MKTSVRWQEQLQFTAKNDANDHVVSLDSNNPAHGGQKQGTTPKHLFLQGIAGCTAMDVISILKKMRQIPNDFSVSIEGKLSEQHPVVFSSFSVTYEISGELKSDRVKRAVQLSQTMYCGLSVMMKQIADFSYRIVLNGTELSIST